MDVSKYAALFLAESREHLSGCNQLAARVGARARGDRARSAGSSASIHTIKGMAATMGFAGVAELAHRTESLLDALRQGRVAADAGDLPAPLPRRRRARPSGREAAAGRDRCSADAALVATLEAATGGGPAGASGAPDPARRRAASPARHDAPRGRVRSR